MQVVKGNPTPEELAAVIAVVASRTSRDRPGAAARPSAAGVWGERARNIRRMPPPGPGAWRSSAWPR